MSEKLSPLHRGLVYTGLLGIAVLGFEVAYSDPLVNNEIHAAQVAIPPHQDVTLGMHGAKYSQAYTEYEIDLAKAETNVANAETESAHLRNRKLWEGSVTSISLMGSILLGWRRTYLAAKNVEQV